MLRLMPESLNISILKSSAIIFATKYVKICSCLLWCVIERHLFARRLTITKIVHSMYRHIHLSRLEQVVRYKYKFSTNFD